MTMGPTPETTPLPVGAVRLAAAGPDGAFAAGCSIFLVGAALTALLLLRAAGVDRAPAIAEVPA